MSEIPFNPYREERHMLWCNRLAQWRAQPEETLFHALAFIALAAIGGVIAMLGWPKLTALTALVVTRWPIAAALVAMLMLMKVQTLALQRQRQHWTQHWLMAQPINESLRRRLLLRQTLIRAVTQGILGAALLNAARAAPSALAIWIAIVVFASIFGWFAARVGNHATIHASRRESVFAPRGRGSFWSWQWIQALASLAPYRLSRMSVLLLLVPRGQWDAVMIALLLMLIAIAGSAWMGSVAVLPAAQRWLATQPLSAKRLLRGCAGFPLLLLGLVVAAATAGLFLLHKPHWALPLAAALIMPAALHWLCTAAQRRTPLRIGAHWALHMGLLIAVLQSMPLLVAPLWIVQMLWLWRRSVRQ